MVVIVFWSLKLKTWTQLVDQIWTKPVGFRYINSKCCDFFTEALLFDARLQDNQNLSKKNAEQKNDVEKGHLRMCFLHSWINFSSLSF